MLKCVVDLVFMDYKDEVTRSLVRKYTFFLASDNTSIMHSSHMSDILVIKKGTSLFVRNLLYNSGSHIFAPLVLVRPKA